MPVRPSCQSSENDENNSRDHEGIGSRPMISKETKDQLANDCSSEGDIRNVFEGIRVGIDISILSFQGGVDGTNDLLTLEMKDRIFTAVLTLLM